MAARLCERLHWEGMTKSLTYLRTRNYTNMQLGKPRSLMRTLEESVRSLLRHQRRGIPAVHLFPPITRHHYSGPLAAEGPVYTGLCGESATRSLQYQSTSWTPPIVRAIIGVAALRIPLHICVLVQRHDSEPNSESSMIAAVEGFKRSFQDRVQQIRCLRLVITRFCSPEAR